MMSSDESDQAAAVIQRRARGHRRRQQYAGHLERLMAMEMEPIGEHHHQIQQWCHVSAHAACLHPESHSVLNKFASCHWNRTGDLLYYKYRSQGPRSGEVIGRELRRCRRMKHIQDVIQIKDEIIEVDDEVIMVTIQAASNDKPLLDYLINLPSDSYNESIIRDIFTSIVKIIKSIHDLDLVCGHLVPWKLYHDGSRIKLMAFGLGKYMSLSDQLLYIPELDQFLAPELVNGGSYRPWSDIYSLGALLYLLLTGSYYTPDHLSSISLPDHLHRLFTQILDPRPYHRLNISQILDHDWVRDDHHQWTNNWTEVQSKLAELRYQRSLYDRILRRYTTCDNRHRFCNLLDYGAYPGFGRSLRESSEINVVLKQAIHQLCSQYLVQTESERSECNPLRVLATILKSIASKKTPKLIDQSPLLIKSQDDGEKPDINEPIQESVV